MKNLDSLLDEAEFAERSVKICLVGRLHTEWEEAQEALEKLSDELPDAPTAGQLRARRVAAEKVKACETSIEEKSITFTFRALPFADYNGLILNHPPRDGNKSDQAYGFNMMEFFPALIRRCIIDVTTAQVAKLFKVLNDRQFDMLAGAALSVNRSEDGSVPFSQSASEAMRDSAATSRSLVSSE